MTKNIAKGGADCSICPWSRSVKESMSMEEYEQYKINYKRVIGYAPSEVFQNCAGCQTPEEKIN